MKLFVVCTVLAACLVASSAQKTDDDLWQEYKSANGKRHHPSEEALRKKNFINTQRKIEEHNKKNLGYLQAHNHFSDMTVEEKKSFLGAMKPKVLASEDRALEVVSGDWDRALPTTHDLRTSPCMNAVKDQGQCGSCWTFATMNCLEFAYCKKTNVTVVLSEQQLVDCDVNGYNAGCNGGFYTDAWNFLKTSGGAMKSSAYPYTSGSTATSGTCAFVKTSAVATVASFAMLRTSSTAAPNVTAIMTYLQDGPVAAAIQVPDSFYNYASGVYSDPTCVTGSTNYNTIDHAIVIVGYGTGTSGDYWIVRNSWSAAWGQSGYFMIKKGVNMCNIEAWAAYVRV